MKLHLVILAVLLAAFAAAGLAAGSPQEPPAAPDQTASQPQSPSQGGPRGQDAKPGDSELDVSTLAPRLREGALWWTVLFTVLFGAIGGVVYELIVLQGNFELPHRPSEAEVTDKTLYAIPRHMIDLGILARVFIGGLAAVAALWVVAPATAFGLLATAVVAGSAGTSIFRSIQDRLLSAIAQKDAAETKAKAKVQNRKVEEAQKEFDALKEKLLAASSSAAGAGSLSFASGSSIDLDDLDRLGASLSEALGAAATIA